MPLVPLGEGVAVAMVALVLFPLAIAVGGAVVGRTLHAFVSQQTELQELIVYFKFPDCAALCLASEQTYCSVAEQFTTEGLVEFT